jgi:hypothetical protein
MHGSPIASGQTVSLEATAETGATSYGVEFAGGAGVYSERPLEKGVRRTIWVCKAPEVDLGL